MLPKRNWAEMTWPDFAGADTQRWIAVLPLAATEQHGPHLPLAVDRVIAEAYLDHARALIPPDLPVTVLPIQAIGQSDEHVSYPGTLTLSLDHRDPGLDRDRRMRAPRRPAQARDRHQPRRQCRGHGDRGARPARAARHVRGHGRLASVRLSGRGVRRGRTPARHPWRRHRDLADARRRAGYGAHGAGAPGRARHRGDAAASSSISAPTVRPASAGRRRTCIRPARSAIPRSPPPRRARPP